MTRYEVHVGLGTDDDSLVHVVEADDAETAARDAVDFEAARGNVVGQVHAANPATPGIDFFAAIVGEDGEWVPGDHDLVAL